MHFLSEKKVNIQSLITGRWGKKSVCSKSLPESPGQLTKPSFLKKYFFAITRIVMPWYRTHADGLFPLPALSDAFLSQMSDFYGAMNSCKTRMAGDEKPTLDGFSGWLYLIRYKIHLKSKWRQGFPIFRTRYESHFSLNYLHLKSQFNMHTHSNSNKDTALLFFIWGQEKQGEKTAGTVMTGSSNVSALM